MDSLPEFILFFALLTNLALLGTSRLYMCIRLVAAQGAAVGLLPLFVGGHGVDLRLILLAIVTFTVKGLVFPRLLFRSLRSANVRREVEPFIGYTASVVIGVATLVACFWLTSGGAEQVATSLALSTPLALPVSLATMSIGLQLIVTRKKALTQVVGYLVLENGIYAFGLILVGEQPLLVELGVLLDVFVAVFVMGIAMFHINQAFDDIDVNDMTQLKG